MIKGRLRRLLEYVRESFWAIPIAILICGALMSVVNLWLDTQFSPTLELRDFMGINLGSFENMRSVLSTTAAAILGVAGVSFSITIASLTLASQQFGPRLIRMFIRDRFIQTTLGFFSATFLYCMLTMQLSTVITGDAYLPVFSLLFVLLLTFVDLVLLIMFIHHICVAIQVESIIKEVVSEMHERAQLLFSKEYSVEKNYTQSELVRFEEHFGGDVHNIKSEDDGYITFINYQELLHRAEETSVYVLVRHRAGDYVMRGDTLITVSSPSSDISFLDAELHIVVSGTRTPEQDLEYTVRQLVEIALRALSPGINDPFTAMTCIDRLGSLLNFLASKSLPSSLMKDSTGTIRLSRDQTSYSSIVETAFNQLRQAAAGHVDVSMRMLEVLTQLLSLSRHVDQAQALTVQAQLVLHGMEVNELLEYDSSAITNRFDEFVVIGEKRYPELTFR